MRTEAIARIGLTCIEEAFLTVLAQSNVLTTLSVAKQAGIDMGTDPDTRSLAHAVLWKLERDDKVVHIQIGGKRKNHRWKIAE